MASRTGRTARALALLAATLGAWGPAPAKAWGPRGHRVAARIAMDRLSPAAALAVKGLLLEGDTLVHIANWADREAYDLPEFRNSGPWHFVNVPITGDRYRDDDCRRGDCVVAKIRQFRKQLADPRTPIKDRRRALLFFVHFVQDIHQPLHVGDKGDRGGNRTQVLYRGRGENLHRLWDSGLIEGERLSDHAWTERVRRRITAEDAKDWVKGGVEDWANESLALAKRAYRLPPEDLRLVPPGHRIGDDYAEAALPVIEERLAQAGVRLAHELNAIFADERPVPKPKAR